MTMETTISGKSQAQHPTTSILLHHAHPAAIALTLRTQPFTELAGALPP